MGEWRSNPKMMVINDIPCKAYIPFMENIPFPRSIEKYQRKAQVKD
jgi:hypothetical protein